MEALFSTSEMEVSESDHGKVGITSVRAEKATHIKDLQTDSSVRDKGGVVVR